MENYYVATLIRYNILTLTNRALTSIIEMVASQRLQTQRAFRIQCTVPLQSATTTGVLLRITLNAHFRFHCSRVAARSRAQFAQIAPILTVVLQQMHLGQTATMQNAIGHMRIASIDVTMRNKSASGGRMLRRKSGTIRVGTRIAFDAAQRVILNNGVGRITAVDRAPNTELADVVAIPAAIGGARIGRAAAVCGKTICKKNMLDFWYDN